MTGACPATTSLSSSSLRLVMPAGSLTRIVPTRSATDPPLVAADAFRVVLPRPVFLVARLGVALLHFVCATHFTAAAVLYYALPNSGDTYVLDFYQVVLPSTQFRPLAIVHFTLAALHVGVLLRLVWRTRPSQVLPSQRVATWRCSSSPWPSASTRVFRYWFARDGVFGVQGAHYEAIAMASELLELGLQTHQAYQMSRLLPDRALNRFFVATLVANCWLTPLVHRFVAHTPTQRLLCRLGDVLLDFVASVGVPVAVASSYWSRYDYDAHGFPLALWYDDAWFIRFLNETPIMLLGSWLDAVGRITFSLGLLLSLISVNNLLTLKQPHQPEPQQNPRHKTRMRGCSRQTTTLALLRHLCACCGVAILTLHLHAEFRDVSPHCVLQVHPWLGSKPVCALLEFDCHADTRRYSETGRSGTGSSGSDSNGTSAMLPAMASVASVLSEVEAGTLQHVVIRHCAHVAFDATFTHFRQLVGIKTYNCSITQWPADAALSGSNHPQMRFAFFVHTSFADATLPPGLLLRDLEFSVTNIARLPHNLHEIWPPDIALCLEFSALRELPQTLLKLQLYSLAIAGNQITTLPDEALQTPGLQYLALNGNPITALPDPQNTSSPFVVSRQLGRLLLVATKLSVLPSWMDTVAFLSTSRTRVFATATPLCEELLSNTSRSAMASRLKCAATGWQIGYYPLQFDVRENEHW